jgi:predicted ferric reductase
LLQYHRQIAYTSLLFILAHPLLLFVADTRYLALLDRPQHPCGRRWRSPRRWRCS